ncbi:DASH family cryptochrome [Salisediminibacterium beveridgei]|uniref:Cryptochrome DASH n=1 Tax=Salisediminibacterium beveridgei TaxID=632773 RepID=A0A1D7QYI6_9BACI|nr:DASH family cryptochrome [Salisediminibacterium beveridgei]AOM84075.1 Cryptochrome [Salisediminibacterium beveridgei]
MQLIWYRQDLRTHDHGPLIRAMEKEAGIVGLYIHDERQDEEVLPGVYRMGQNRRRFLAESLIELGKALQRLGISFTIRSGDVVDEVSFAIREYGVEEVLVQDHPSVWERRELEQLMNRHPEIKWSIFEGHTLIKQKDLPVKLGDFPMSFSTFRGKLEKYLGIPKKHSAFSIEDQGLFTEMESRVSLMYQQAEGVTFSLPDFMKSWLDGKKGIVQGGERAGLDRLDSYVSQNGGVYTYKETRDGLFDFEDSSKLSFWLSRGALSPRRVYQALMKVEAEHGRNLSSYWLFFELLWRDYFQWLMRATDERLFVRQGLLNDSLPWHQDQEAFQKWRQGNTGYPLVDAAMAELNQTGFMSNRARQNAASFLTKNLGIDWLWGAAYFEAMLIDFDPASNYGNWAYQAGVGTDLRELRAFNVIGQGKRYDPSGDYARYWLHLPKELPGHVVYDPAKLNMHVKYAEPMVDLDQSIQNRKKELGM